LAPYVTEEWIGGADGWLPVALHVGGVEEMSFQSSFEGIQLPESRMEAGVLYIA